MYLINFKLKFKYAEKHKTLEKEEMTDDDFFNLLNQNILENDTDKKPKKKILIWRNTTILLTQWGLVMKTLCLMLRLMYT